MVLQNMGTSLIELEGHVTTMLTSSSIKTTVVTCSSNVARLLDARLLD